MTNEEAISYLENAICELDAGIKVYSGTIKEEFIEQRKCFAIALSALREQAERDKGCEYCAGYEAEFMLPVIEMSENTANSLDIDGNFAYIHCHCGRHTVGKINYCPMCGKRLEAQHE